MKVFLAAILQKIHRNIRLMEELRRSRFAGLVTIWGLTLWREALKLDYVSALVWRLACAVVERHFMQ
jgi:hypothetical protein